MIDMGTPLQADVDTIVHLAQANGAAAGKKFVAEYGIGRNERIDKIILEGLETNVSLIIQRLPWASQVPEFSAMKLYPREVQDDLIWTYLQAYDIASRNQIRDAIAKATYRKDTRSNG